MSQSPPDDRTPRMLRPSTLEPVRLDLRRVILVGIGLWTVALVVTGALAVTDRTDAMPALVCAAGIALGGAGLLWERRNR